MGPCHCASSRVAAFGTRGVFVEVTWYLSRSVNVGKRLLSHDCEFLQRVFASCQIPMELVRASVLTDDEKGLPANNAELNFSYVAS